VATPVSRRSEHRHCEAKQPGREARRCQWSNRSESLGLLTFGMSVLRVCAARLIAGLLLNMALLWMVGEVSRWSSIQREFRVVFICAATGAIALASVVPVLRRGTDIQKVAAIVLMVLPVMAFGPALGFYIKYR
jgi:hypothetical protein